MKKNTVYLVQGAFIAALYSALTYFFEPISFSGTQLRISEALTVLPALTPGAIPGLTVGCIIANLSGPYGLADIVFGSMATLLAALCTYCARNIKFRNLPILSAFFPVIFNSIIVGAEIAVLASGGFTLPLLLSSAVSVALGEAIVCIACGLPLYSALNKTKIFERDR